ncbi:uncharacterized protein [Haliotis asinina]|uniref:uncharacterized protein isoform X1 n=1 Tax=Haliotis asinina TaxID=109174 RepID=UPI003531ACBD
MDKQYSVQFFATFVDNLQELCKSFLDFNQLVEVSGYVCVEIDNTKKERYVLSELVQSCGNVISESYCTKAFRTPGKPMSQNIGRQQRLNPRSKENLNGRCRPGQLPRQERRPPPPGPQNPRMHQKAVVESQMRPRGRNFGLKVSNVSSLVFQEKDNGGIPSHSVGSRMPGQRRGFAHQQDREMVPVKSEKQDFYPEEGGQSHFFHPEARQKTRVLHEEWEGSDTYVYRNVSIERVTNVPQRPAGARITQFADDEEQSPGSESDSEDVPPQQQGRPQGNWNRTSNAETLEQMMDQDQEWSGHQPQQEQETSQPPILEDFEIKPDLSLVKQEVEDPEYEASEMKPEDFPMPEEEFYAREQMAFAARGIHSPKQAPVRLGMKPPAATVVAKHSPRPTVPVQNVQGATVLSGPSTSQISMRSPDVGFARPQEVASVPQQVIDKSLLMIDEETDEFVEVDMEEFLEDEELAELSQEMMEDSQPGGSKGESDDKEIKKYKSSLKNQRHALKLFNDYQKKRGEGMKPIQTIHPERLDNLLSDFFLTLRKNNGQEFGPLYLKKIHCHLDRYLQDANYPFSITKDDQFKHSNQILRDKIGELKARSKGGPVVQTPITEDDVTIMFEAGELGGCNPDTLLNTMWFVNNYFFSIKQPADHFNLTWGDFHLAKDEDGHEYLECPAGKFKGGNIYADKEDPERCYVRLYKRYRDKRPPHTVEDDAPFYLTPNRITRADSVWYSPEHAPPSRLNGIFKKIAAVCGLQDKKMP